MQLDIAAAGFRQRKQAADHFFELFGAACDHLDIIAGSIAEFLFFEQLDIADHRGQRRLEVMRNIGNQINLELLTFSRLFQAFLFDLQRPRHPRAIQLLESRDKRVQFGFHKAFQSHRQRQILQQNRKKQ